MAENKIEKSLCPKCGNEVSTNDFFCPHCNYAVAWSVAKTDKSEKQYAVVLRNYGKNINEAAAAVGAVLNKTTADAAMIIKDH